MSVIDAEFCHAVTRYAQYLVLENPSFLKSIFIPGNCDMKSLVVVKSPVKQIVFEQNRNIKQIVLRMSDLVEIPRTINKLTYLLEATFQFSNLEYLDLRLFCSLANIQELDLLWNNITTVTGNSADAVCQSALKIIKLNENSIRELSLDVFAPFKKLVRLDLTSNKLESLLGSLANPALEQLILTNNQLTVLDMCKWAKPNTMLELHVSFNHLSSVPLCLEALGNVTYVDFRFNFIKLLDVQAFSALPKLECINLSFNNITTIPLDESVYSPVLKVLQLMENPLGNITIPTGSFEKLKIVLDNHPVKFL
uniref:Uncharacterized protein n=1 Tax=Anopheles maculatus TaxID=74869 RepID=A0A182T048_9DIPT